MSTLHLDLLDGDQRHALSTANATLAPHRAALAGGLSLALRFGHRRSRDMNWFLSAQSDINAVADTLASRSDVTLTVAEPGTIHGHWAGVLFSVIRYRYPLINEVIEGYRFANLRTTTTMKLLAALNRGTKRDLIDLAARLERDSNLSAMLQQACEDIPGLTTESLLRALAYHDDAEIDPDPEGLSPDGWPRAKTTLIHAIRAVITPR